jgi:oxygen-independent coproporphyrinogen-3 oxidase
MEAHPAAPDSERMNFTTAPTGALHGAAPVIDAALIRKHAGQGPRYTSYPTADRFVEAFDSGACRHWLANRRIGAFARPLGLYVHVPFCDTLCFYCACNKIATRDHSKARKYVGYL